MALSMGIGGRSPFNSCTFRPSALSCSAVAMRSLPIVQPLSVRREAVSVSTPRATSAATERFMNLSFLAHAYCQCCADTGLATIWVRVQIDLAALSRVARRPTLPQFELAVRCGRAKLSQGVIAELPPASLFLNDRNGSKAVSPHLLSPASVAQTKRSISPRYPFGSVSRPASPFSAPNSRRAPLASQVSALMRAFLASSAGRRTRISEPSVTRASSTIPSS